MTPFETKTIYEGFKGLHFHRGKLLGALDPGKHLLFGWGHRVLEVDTRPKSEVVGGQEVSTQDGGSFKVTLVVRYQVQDVELYYKSGPTLRFAETSQMPHFSDERSIRIHQLVQVATRNWMVDRTFDTVLEQRAIFAADLLPILATEAALVGLEVLSLDLLDLTISGWLKAAYADLLKSRIEGEAALARARNEAATMRSLLNTARLVREHPNLLELRVLSSGQKPRVTFLVGGESKTVSSEASGVEQES